MTQQIIDPIDPALVKAELTPERLLRQTNKGGNLIYVVDGRECPATMREIGRLREETFRAAGGGTGKETDIDDFDLMDPPCRQLIVYDPEHELILGGYRYIIGSDIRLNPDGTPRIATAHIFNFSDRFIDKYLPYTIELGRSFVRLQYQSSQVGAKAIFALDNLWDGLGALTVLHPEVRYLFGKMTMYPSYDRSCRDMILYFLKRYFPDPDSLVTPVKALPNDYDTAEMDARFNGGSFKEDYRILNHAIRDIGFNIPPLVNSYMSLSPTMRVFGTAVNDEFGDVEETGILIAISDIFEEKKRRHIGTYRGVSDELPGI
ncbi:MAG: GNAT family N-acetyltransferase [Muribaculaceae bacterium]|nr:GNAT family N-acetyltransferase [Muribaculaceae bacterium]